MAVVPNASSSSFELKSASLSLVAVVVKTTDVGLLSQAMAERFGDAPGLFDQDPVAIDLSEVHEAADAVDFEALVQLLREHKMLPVAARGGNAAQMAAALAAGLSEATMPAPPRASAPAVASAPTEPAAATEAPAPRDTVIELPADPRPTLIVDKPLRSGQRVYAKGADLVVLGAVSHGAEVIADGNVHVYGPLRGRALAGALGDTSARIFTTCMQPQLISIAGIYRTTDTELSANVLGKPAQVRLELEKLLVEPLKTD
ncbi:MAG TPA: septum site-determining protein MinC [Burkholderiaceae bacterium]